LDGPDQDEVQRLRGLVVRVAKVTNSLLACGGDRKVRVLAESLQGEIHAYDPALDDGSELPSVGRRRTSDDLGRAGRYVIPTKDLGPEVAAMALWD
jgi:hypothetical protein